MGEQEEEYDDASASHQSQPLYENASQAPLPDDFDDMDLDVESKKRNRDARNKAPETVPNPIRQDNVDALNAPKVPIAGDVLVEQDSEVLMEGREDVWSAQNDYDPYTADAQIDRNFDNLQ